MRNSLIGHRLFRMRRDAGLKREDLADLLNISIETYSKIEQGKAYLQKDYLDILEQVLHWDIHYIISGKPQTVSPSRISPLISDFPPNEQLRLLRLLYQLIDFDRYHEFNSASPKDDMPYCMFQKIYGTNIPLSYPLQAPITGRILRYERELNHLTKSQMAQKLHIGRNHYAQIEEYTKIPSFKTLCTVEEIFGYPVDYLLNGDLLHTQYFDTALDLIPDTEATYILESYQFAILAASQRNS
ncbi:MAG: helix-turn-helix transcriptional regulator [Clostridiales bacterium]|nr:helix-turn-helix transcriptional regulator [Clostridiales bacterium]